MKTLLILLGTAISGMLLINGCTPPPAQSPAQTENAAQPLPQHSRPASLQWKPNLTKNDLNCEPLAIYNSISFSIPSVSDSRPDIRIIGKTLEDKMIQNEFVPLVITTSVAKWCNTGTIKILQELSLKNDEKHGKCRLEIEIVDFSIEDNITQTGKISLRISASTSDELLIWEGNINGSSDLYYRPKDSDGISECLSNTLLVTIHNFLTEKSFRDAVTKTFELP